MSRIASAFEKNKAFIAFVTAGDPNLDVTEQLLIKMQESGADLIEIGIPFSDPVAEGPVIQEANERALAAGTTTDKIFDLVAKVRQRVTVPLVFLTYINPIYTYGVERFMKKCKETGMDGIIIPDVPYEERNEVSEVMKTYGIERISMIAPTSKDRIQMIAKEAEGFVYCVSSLGVTGVRSNITSDIDGMIRAVREVTDIPCAIGFGIATPEQAKTMATKADGAIVGSAIVKMVAAHGERCVEKVGEYIQQMKAAVLEAN